MQGHPTIQTSPQATTAKNVATHLQVAFVICMFAQGMNALAGPLDNDLQVAIINSKALGNNGASVQANKTNAVVSTYRAAGDDNDKCKIKAILVGKALFDKVPTLVSVDISFIDPQGHSSIGMSIQKPTIQEFASGKSKKETLLNTISVHPVGAPVATSQAQDSSYNRSDTKKLIASKGGFDYERRAFHAESINMLISLESKNHLGINTAALIETFNEEERARDIQAFTAANNKLNSLIEASNLLVQQKNVRGHGQTTSPVAPGPLQGERTTLWNSIQKMKIDGVNTTDLESAFSSLEAVVGQKDEGFIRLTVQQLYGRIPQKYR
ncbi:MAG TPA: hypothetical protein V6C97_20310 [Oculatellaceae cyanobacterium]